MDLQRYDRLAEERDNAPVREYLAILAERPQKLLDAVSRAEKLLQANQKLAAKTQKDCPLRGNENRPPRLRDLVSDLHQNLLKPLRNHYSTLPQRLREFAGKIKAAKAADFKFFSPQTIAKLDIDKCNSLMSELLWLEQFPEKVAALEALISEWWNSPYGGQASTPPAAPTFAPKPSLSDPDDGKTYSNFDPRR